MTLHERQIATALLISSLLAGCGGMIPGTIYSQDGTMMSFAIEKAMSTGAVTAHDTKTGESFSGTYVGVRERVVGFNNAVAQSQIQPASGGRGDGVATASFGNAVVGSNMVPATAFLKGDKGSMLTCEIQIQAGLSPHGIGECRDGAGKSYRLQF